MTYEVYHVGFLPVDRVHDSELDTLATDYLERATSHGVPVFKQLGDDSPRGRGEGHLAQCRLWSGVYEYRFYPAKKEQSHGSR
jgi:hypothetical protein